MTNPLGPFITARWKELDLKQADFCRLIGSPAAWIQQIREGKKTPPLTRVERWADTLKLTGRQRAYFLDLCALMHVPAGPGRDSLNALVHRAHGMKPLEEEAA